MKYDRNDPWMTCGDRDDRKTNEEEVARCLYSAEYDMDEYPWESLRAADKLTYLEQARKLMRDFIVLHN